MNARTAYLDHNATTVVRPRVLDVVCAQLAKTGNASSVHAAGRDARKVVEHARSQVADLIGVPAQWVTFTSGGTEANNLAIRSAKDRALLVSAVEHDSVLAPAKAVNPGCHVLPVDETGVVKLDVLASTLEECGDGALVSVMYANNETGTIQPIADICRLAHQFGALVHVDAVQAAGKIPVDAAACGIDILTLSAHKMGGPQGVGALIADPAIALPARTLGGGQEFGRRAGTENVAAIAGFGEACDLARNEPADWQAIGALRDDLEQRIRAIDPDATAYATGADRLPNTSCVSMPGVGSETQIMAFDLDGIAVSAGSACSSGKVTPSHVLLAMGIGEQEASTAIRVSLGWNSSEKDIDAFVEAWRRIYIRTKRGVIAESAA